MDKSLAVDADVAAGFWLQHRTPRITIMSADETSVDIEIDLRGTEPSSKVEPANVDSVTAVFGKGTDEEIKIALAAHIRALAKKHGLADYKLIFLWDEKDEISHWHANRIYSVASGRSCARYSVIDSERRGKYRASLLD